jgi:hypothetical protein
MSAATETWLDLMVPLPLARGVPAASVYDSTRGVVVCVEDGCIDVVPRYGCVLHYWRTREDAGASPGRDFAAIAHLRVDLDDPQGQRYAVCALLDAHGATVTEWGIDGAQFTRMVRLLRGKGTDADKLWLARALREAQR